MEGVVNHTLRDLLTRLGGIDRCVTEFIRITDQLLPPKVFLRLCPELAHGGTTPSGVPVYLQLLGGKPQFMAANAARAAKLGAPGIDINFGCPAKVVNRNDGGSILLREPQRLHDIVRAVREAVPAATPVTAKIRLGYLDSSLLADIAGQIESAGANELTIHARTREDGYRPPAHWHLIAPVRRQLGIPIIANGEIWSPADAAQARLDSGCGDLMLGRGLLARPDLAAAIRAGDEGRLWQPLAWHRVVELLCLQLQACRETLPPKQLLGPVKQWLGYLRRHYREAGLLFEAVKRIVDPDQMAAALMAQMQARRETPETKTPGQCRGSIAAA
jgi:tRNA-dihydrouridine synthase C